MATYLVGIGGTGAKCIEAATHLSAAGVLPSRELYTLFVDPDRSNGNLDRAKVTLDGHVDGQKMRLGESPLFSTSIQRADTAVWSPFDGETGADVNLSNAIGYNRLRASEEEADGLFDALYTPEEKKADLTVGFRGHPSIGAAVMAKQLSLSETDPWKTFKDLVEKDRGGGQAARVFLCGSVFGGTGAAGLPTIGKLIKQELSGQEDGKLEVACGLVLPYFSFDGRPEDEGIKARAKSFIPNTQSALKYYWEKRHDNIFDSTYVVGDPGMSSVGEASVGGSDQRNDPHFVELLVALAGADFFENGGSNGKIAIMSRESGERLGWGDLPHPTPTRLRRRLGQMIHFSFAYISTFKPALDAIRDGDQPARSFPWYLDLVERHGVSLQNDEHWRDFEKIEEHARRFLVWIAKIHSSARGTDVRLVSCDAFAQTSDSDVKLKSESDFRREQFGQLHRPGGSISDDHLKQLWAKLSSTPIDPDLSSYKEAEGTGKLIQALYEACNPNKF